MFTSTARKLRHAALLTSVVFALIGIAATPASGAANGAWYVDALNLQQNHRTAVGEGVVVALIGGPVDPSIPELAGQRVQAGKAFCDRLPGPLVKGADFGPDVYHETSMATLIVGSGRGTRPDGSGILGVAPGATLRVYAVDDAESKADFACVATRTGQVLSQVEVVEEAVRQAVADGADIINMSFSLTGLEDVVDEAQNQGVVVVASVNRRIRGQEALQNGVIGEPAALGGVVAVTATSQDGRVWPGATTGNVSVAAPGVELSSGSVNRSGRWSSDGTETGTSGATALVSGMLAVVKSRYPEATGAQLVQHLLRTAGSPDLAYDTERGFGLASLDKMMESDPTRHPNHLPFRNTPPDFLDDAGRRTELDGPQAKATSITSADSARTNRLLLLVGAMVGAVALSVLVLVLVLIVRARRRRSAG